MPPFIEVFASHLLFAQNDGNPQAAPFNPIYLIVIISALFYFIVLRPDRKKRQETEKRLKELKKNDRVVTIGGIIGSIVQAKSDSDEITIKIDESTNTKMRILRSAVREVIRNGSDGETKPSTPEIEKQIT
jgi:preprotein translocase subunit YajC